MGRHSSFPSARHPESESSPLGMVERVVLLGSWEYVYVYTRGAHSTQSSMCNDIDSDL